MQKFFGLQKEEKKKGIYFLPRDLYIKAAPMPIIAMLISTITAT